MTAVSVHIRSISSVAWNVLQAGPDTAVLLGHFRRAVNLLVGDQVLALVSSEVGNGPFHIVVAALPNRSLPHQVPIVREGERHCLGPWALHLPPDVAMWDARPAWEDLHLDYARLAYLNETVAQAHTLGVNHTPFAGLLQMLVACQANSAHSKRIARKAMPRVQALDEALSAGNADDVRKAAAGLAGWGPGLTPSGDDFLAGVMLGLWLKQGKDTGRNISAEIFSDWIYEAAAPRTTHLSRAFLRAARDGLADARWHHLLATLGQPASNGRRYLALIKAVEGVLNFGATSGLDMMTGFLWSLDNRKLTTENYIQGRLS